MKLLLALLLPLISVVSAVDSSVQLRNNRRELANSDDCGKSNKTGKKKGPGSGCTSDDEDDGDDDDGDENPPTPPPKMTRIAVVGLGHNGLFSIACLQKAYAEQGITNVEFIGLEKESYIGGMVAADMTMFGSEYSVASHAIANQLLTAVGLAEFLDLAKYGYELVEQPAYVNFHGPGNTVLVEQGRLDKTMEQLAALGQQGEADAAALAGFYNAFAQAAPFIVQGLLASSPSFEQQFQLWAKNPDQFRSAFATAYDTLHALFRTEEAKWLFGAWATGHLNLSLNASGSMSFVSAFYAVVQTSGSRYFKGGASNLISSLEQLIASHGNAVLKANIAVTEMISNDSGSVTQIVLSDGTTEDVDFVIATVHPHQLATLLPEKAQSSQVDTDLEQVPIDLAYCRLHFFGPEDLLQYEENDEMTSKASYVHILPTSFGDSIVGATAAQYQDKIPTGEQLTLAVTNDSAADPSRAPPGQRLMSILIGGVPFSPVLDSAGNAISGWTNDVQNDFVINVVVPRLARAMPNVGKVFDGSTEGTGFNFVAPTEWEINTMIRGDLAHGRLTFDNVNALRASPDIQQNIVAGVPNLVFAGSGAPAGPGVSGLSGFHGANAVLALSGGAIINPAVVLGLAEE